MIVRPASVNSVQKLQTTRRRIRLDSLRLKLELPKMKPLFVVSSISLTVACATTALQAADTIYTNANIYTVNAEQPQAEAMAVENGQIVAIGDISDVEAFKTDDTNMVDLGGRFVMPGFISSHFHPGVAGLMSTGAQLVGINDPEEILNTIRQFAADNPGNSAIFGFGWSPSTFAPDGPQATFLDRAVSDRPVYLIASDAHSAWVNSKGLELLNITPDTPDPIPGVHYYKRDADGNATGWLVEANAFWPALKVLGLDTKEKFTTAHQNFLPNLPMLGITSVFDAGVPMGGENSAAALLEMEMSGALPVRYFASHYLLSKADAETAVEDFQRQQATYDGELFDFYAIKISNDGTIEASTAALHQPYLSGDGSHYGSVVFSEDEMLAMMRRIDQANIPVMIHAIGDRTTTEAVNALEQVKAERPDGTARHTITHLQLMRDSDMDRMKELGIVAQISPPWAQDVNASLDTWKALVGHMRALRMMRFRSMFEKGLHISMGSDFPASGVGLIESSPLHGIEVGMTRTQPGLEGARQLPDANETLTVDQLIYGYTMGSAYQLAAEDRIGSLEVGKAADFIVLDQDITAVDPSAIHKTQVLHAFVNGTQVYAREQ